MPKNKTGLHKGISSIFSGVPVPKRDGDEQQKPPGTQEAPTYGPPSHLIKGTAESSPVLNSLMKEPPAETTEPKTDEKTTAAPAPVQEPAPVIKIKRSRPAWLEQIQHLIQDKLFAPKPGVSPARQKATVVLVPVLFIGMVVAFYKVLGGAPGKTTEFKEIKPSNAIAASAGTIDWKIPKAYPATLRDPMQFKVQPPDTNVPDTDKTTEKISIKGILYSEDDPSAIIGTEIVYEGDTVSSGAKVIKINQDSVEFEMNGKKWSQKVK